jgi:hypothetical protein
MRLKQWKEVGRVGDMANALVDAVRISVRLPQVGEAWVSDHAAERTEKLAMI